MDLRQLFTMQTKLDQHIVNQHHLEDEDLFDRKILALLVELGELANETRAFKFWSLKPPASRETILEEFVDGVHFILSLGIDLGFESEVLDFLEEKKGNTVEQFLVLYQQITAFQSSKSIEDYKKLIQDYFTLAVILGFSEEQIVQAYISKNEVNFERQEQGY
ncbi:dUTP diphosphatase [Bacillus sp. PS06]|uniref:dUTP diphosphatase n=1 Tax=Bacillus sp. PS06 TaxID=2764176 RepID=UPI001785EC7A|nr:dUTP diphosphatase [Bacillus sp. PS06]MBD8068920.1 dUTP diphosphatase [Bacillus sp. PS06]